ncbi:hypothetical protein ACFSJU_17410 [Paradesertivirga mongoliensis]|uniref:Lipocalin-like domain-containing protein n=1 Tax=Paradesertivirga mongoliensis TaxID=2100740 RepID=A0ABW4ZRC6_9SPHI|nr:hypothetical protein [Pedobacter mongoliensis]
MKNQSISLILLLIASIFTSCNKEDIEFQNQFEKSYRAWLVFKKESNNSYTYTTVFGSWTGFAGQTKITVASGRIVERHFKYTAIPLGALVPQESLEWTENENQLSSHTYTPASLPLTLDQIYDKAKNEWLVERKNVKTYFEAENNALISSCGFVEDGCQDDCFRGITIASIEKN